MHEPPFDLAAEEAILGAIMAVAQVNPPEAVALARSAPPPGDFYRGPHETLMAHLLAAADEGAPMEPVAMMARLQIAGDFREGSLDGPRLFALIERAAVPSQMEFYSQRVRVTAKLRRAVSVIQRADMRLGAVRDPEDVDAALYEAMSDLEDEINPASLLRVHAAWKPVPIAGLVDDIESGRYVPVTPSIGEREDGSPLLYPGRQHAAYGESESGKSWFALLLCHQEINRGNHVVYLDFEDEPGGIVGRLLAFDAANTKAIIDRFHYVRPDEPVDLGSNRSTLAQMLGDLRPTLAVVDGVTEAMALHGLDLKDNTDIARFNRAVPSAITGSGAASLTLDHVAKDKDTRGRYAIGGQHKLAGLSGAAFSIMNRERFGRDLNGRSGIYVTKDRPGQLRKHALTDRGMHWFADLLVDSLTEDGAVWARLTKPEFRTHPTMPTAYMERVSVYLEGIKRPATQNDIYAGTGATSGGNRVEKQGFVKAAIAQLELLGHLRVEDGPRRSRIHTLIKPYRQGDEEPPEPDEPEQGRIDD